MRQLNFTQKYTLLQFNSPFSYPFVDYDVYVDFLAGINNSKSGFQVYQPGFSSPITQFQPATGYLVVKKAGPNFGMSLPDLGKPPFIQFKRRYNIFTYPYSIPVDFSLYRDYLESVLIVNKSGTGFASYQFGFTSPFTTFEPGSSYLVVAFGDFLLENPEPSPTPTSTPASTPTCTPTVTLTPTPQSTLTPTGTPQSTPTRTPDATATATPSFTPTHTSTAGVTPNSTTTQTPTPTRTPVPTATSSNTQTPTQTKTPTNTATPAPTITPTNTSTTTLTTTSTPSNTQTKTPTQTQTPTQTKTQTPTPTTTVTLSNTQTQTPSTTVTLSNTQTQTPSTTKTLTPTSTPANLFPQTNGATIVHFLGRSTSSQYTTNRRVRVFYSTNFDTWTYDTQFPNSAFHGMIYDPGTTIGYTPPTREFILGAGCIPTGAAYTNITRTLFHVQGFVTNSVYDFRICKSDNTAGNGTYNTFNISSTFQQTNTTTNSPYKRISYNSDCFYYSARNLMYVVYTPYPPNSTDYGYYAYSYNTVTNQVVDEPIKIIDVRHVTNTYNSFPTGLYHNNDMLQKSPNGDVYLSFVEAPTTGTPTSYKIRTFVFNRNVVNNSLYFTEAPQYTSNIPATAPLGSPYNQPMVMRYAKFNSNTLSLSYLYTRSRSDRNYMGPLADLYVNFYNNNSWSDPILIAQKIPFNGGTTNSMANGQLLPFTGYSTGYDMYFHPIENNLHILYITDTQSTDNKSINVTSSNCKIRLMKLNSSGTILSDVLVFDAGEGAQVIGGMTYGAAEFINYFYKSTNNNEFIPYFSVCTNNGPTSTHRIFKYVNGAYSEIYSVPWNPMGAGSGPNGCHVKVITT